MNGLNELRKLNQNYMNQFQILRAENIKLKMANLELESQLAKLQLKMNGHALGNEIKEFEAEFPNGFDWETLKPKGTD